MDTPVFLIAVFGVLSGFGIGILFYLNRLADIYRDMDGQVPQKLNTHKLLVLVGDILSIVLFTFGIWSYCRYPFNNFL